jgi:hypothetical protein
MKTYALAAMLVGLFLAGRPISALDQQDREKQKAFITDDGTSSLYSGDLLVKVSMPEVGPTRWEVTFRERPGEGWTTISKQDPEFRMGSPWFIFPASAQTVWVYNGEKSLVVTGIRGGDSFSQTIRLPARWEDLPEGRRPPKAVVNRLPAPLRAVAKGEK